jgi:hypothetical protein
MSKKTTVREFTFQAKADPANDEYPWETPAEEVAHMIEQHAFLHGWSAQRDGNVVHLFVTKTQFDWLTKDGVECGQCEADLE